MLENQENTTEKNVEATETPSNESVVTDTKNETAVVESEKVEYSKLTMEELVEKLTSMINSEPIHKIKEQVSEIKDTFNKKFKALVAEKKQAFLAEGGNEIDFHFDFPLRKKMFDAIGNYRNKVQEYYNQKEQQRKENYKKKLEIIEELKGLLTNVESAKIYPELKAIQDKWRSIGQVPFDKNEDVWQTFRFYEQKVYDFLHLNSDFRNLDFKHNLEKKTKLADRAEELAKDPDVNKAFKELQIMHRIWKEEIGPVSREFSEEVWARFSNATKIIHDKRREILSELEKTYEANIPKKEAVIQKINNLATDTIASHKEWQEKIGELEKFREEFFKIGKVTKDKADELWESFREATRNFNQIKNQFYKEVKNEHQVNLEKKRALVEKANELKNSEDFKETTEVFKKIQADWKKIGHIPRKYSDKLWNEFRGACNHFFDRLHAVQDEENKELVAVFNKKKEYLENLKTEIKDVEVVALEKIKTYIKEWKELGQVPSKMRFIESKFNKVIDKLFTRLDLDKNEAIMYRFKNNIDTFLAEKNYRKIDNEATFIRKKIDEINREIKILENNLGFFKNTSKDNPMVKSVYKNIEKYQADVAIWIKKLNYLKSLDK